MLPSVLIVDDEQSILQALSGLLYDEGFEVLTASNGYEALKLIETEAPDLVLLDIWMPGIDGIDTLKEIRKDNPNIQVIIITGHGNIETAVKAIKLGAFDLIEKPISFDKVIVSINNALNFRRLEEENKYLRKKTIEKNSINGTSEPVQTLKKQIATVAPADSWVLIKGENGTGKELIARTIHQLSPRVQEPMIDVSCAAIPEELIESELFGHEKGAISGSNTKKIGKFELANNGTIFFDEIGDMSLKTQAKILRVLQEKKFQRLGGSRILSIDVRVIAATNKDLEAEIHNGTFREDLFYRLNVVPIQVPPLRDRKDDIPLLVETFLTEFSAKNRSPRKKIAEKATNLLCRYSWPGNVRELKNLIERLTIMVKGDTIQVDDVPMPYKPISVDNDLAFESKIFSISSLDTAKKTFEKEFILRKLDQNGNDMELTAKALGIQQKHLEQCIKSLKIKRA